MKIKYKLFFIILNLGFLYVSVFTRNPFLFEYDKTSLKEINNYENISLVAVLNCKDYFGAVLLKTDLQETVYLGDFIWGYKVLNICKNEITLSKNNKKIKLEI